MTEIKKNDFIEIEFTGYSNQEPFDTTNKKTAKELGIKTEVKPMIISVGNDMVIKGLDEELIGKDIGKNYKIKIPAEKAFGKRDPSLLRVVPLRVFHQKEINPYPGLTLQMDNHIVKILSVSGGRVNVDFNNPLAGKEVEYDITINKKIEDNKEKINAILEFFLKQKTEFEIKENKVIFNDVKLAPIMEIFAPRIKEMTGLEVVAKKPEIIVEELINKKDKPRQEKKEDKDKK